MQGDPGEDEVVLGTSVAAGQAPDDAGSVTAPSLTTEAVEVIARADEGGVPMFTSANLARIAVENGIPVNADMTPNQIIDELRRRA